LAWPKAGADIIGVSGSLELSGSDIEKQVQALGRSSKLTAANLSDREALYAFIKKLNEDNPVIDILVNNAGTIMRKPAAEQPG